MGTLSVDSIGGDRYRISVRGHELVVDQPVDGGGDDLGPTPTELFVASLAACTAFYAGRGLGRAAAGPKVACNWTMSDTPPWRVTAIDLEVEVPGDTSDARMAAVRRAIAGCTVHNTLTQQPAVRICARRSRERHPQAA